MSVRRIGIDVGGTNTDAVLLQDGRVVHAVKTPTTADVTSGIVTVLAELARHPEVHRDMIDGVVGPQSREQCLVQRVRHVDRLHSVGGLFLELGDDLLDEQW